MTAVRPKIAVMRSALCADGPMRMQADAKLAIAKLSKDDDWLPSALLVQGAAAALLGDADRADSILEEAAERAQKDAAQ